MGRHTGAPESVGTRPTQPNPLGTAMHRSVEKINQSFGASTIARSGVDHNGFVPISSPPSPVGATPEEVQRFAASRRASPAHASTTAAGTGRWTRTPTADARTRTAPRPRLHGHGTARSVCAPCPNGVRGRRRSLLSTRCRRRCEAPCAGRGELCGHRSGTRSRRRRPPQRPAEVRGPPPQVLRGTA
jgi:hypothetical protein